MATLGLGLCNQVPGLWRWDRGSNGFAGDCWFGHWSVHYSTLVMHPSGTSRRSRLCLHRGVLADHSCLIHSGNASGGNGCFDHRMAANSSAGLRLGNSQLSSCHLQWLGVSVLSIRMGGSARMEHRVSGLGKLCEGTRSTSRPTKGPSTERFFG